jgi:hypothetical protein
MDSPIEANGITVILATPATQGKRTLLRGPSLPAPSFAVLGRRVWIEVSQRSIGPHVEMRRSGGPSPRRGSHRKRWADANSGPGGSSVPQDTSGVKKSF